MKARFFFLSFLFFFAACNPTERDDDGRSKVKRKSYRGRRGRRGGGRERIKKENSYRAQRRSLRGEASEERRVLLILFEPARVHLRSCSVLLRDAVNYGK